MLALKFWSVNLVGYPLNVLFLDCLELVLSSLGLCTVSTGASDGGIEQDCQNDHMSEDKHSQNEIKVVTCTSFHITLPCRRSCSRYCSHVQRFSAID